MTLVNVLERQVNDLEVEINTLPDVTFDVVKLSRFNHTNKKITVTNGGIRIFYPDIKKRVDFVPFDGVTYMKLTGEDKVCFSLKGFKNEKVYETKVYQLFMFCNLFDLPHNLGCQLLSSAG